MDELTTALMVKACPFCGETDQLFIREHQDSQSYGTIRSIECRRCAVTAHIRKWNIRPRLRSRVFTDVKVFWVRRYY